MSQNPLLEVELYAFASNSAQFYLTPHEFDVDLDGNLIGSYQATGARPQFVSQINMIGVKLDPRLFEPPVDAAQKG